MPTEPDDAIWRVSETPPVSRLMEEFQRAGGLASCSTRKQRNDDIRYARWTGRTTDYKKHREAIGEAPVPYEDAWDGRVYFADAIIEALVSVCLTAFKQANIQVTPTGAEDVAVAANAEKVLKKYMARDREALDDEAELMLQFGFGFGQAVWQTYWDKCIGMKLVTVEMDKLVEVAEGARQALEQQGGEMTDDAAEMTWMLAQFPALIADEAQEDSAVDVLQGLSKTLAGGVFAGEKETYGSAWLENYELSTAQARKCVRELRTTGQGQFPAPYVVKNAPCVVAREVGHDYFNAPETTELEKAPMHTVREWMTPAAIMEAQAADGWNKQWCERAIKNTGTTTEWSGLGGEAQSWMTDDDALSGGETKTITGKSGLVEVLHHYVRYVTAEGIPQIWVTVVCPHALKDDRGNDLWAKHYALEDSSSYGFSAFRWQKKRRNFHENFGIPELVGSDQQLIKRTLDQLTDRADMELNPPWLVRNRMAMRYKVGPGGQVDMKRPGDVQQMELGAGNPKLGFEIINDARYRTDNYFGLMTERVLPSAAQNRQQHIVGKFLGSAKAMLRQYWRLIQENADAAELTRIAGGDPQFPQDPEDIAGEFDLTVDFDVKNLDMEFVWKKLEAVAKLILPMDRAGVIDIAKFVRMLLTSIDPTLAQALIQDDASAAQALYRDVDQQVLRMSNGNEAEYVELDPTAKRKLEFLEQVVKGNPVYQEGLGLVPGEADPLFIERFAKYRDNLQMSVKQEEEAKIGGRLGIVPDEAKVV